MLPLKMDSYERFAAEETGALGGWTPIFFISSTSPRLEAGLWPICCAAMRLLRCGTVGLFAAGFCLGGSAMIGEGLLTRTALANFSSRRAATDDVGVASVGEAATGASGMAGAGDCAPEESGAGAIRALLMPAVGTGVAGAASGVGQAVPTTLGVHSAPSSLGRPPSPS